MAAASFSATSDDGATVTATAPLRVFFIPFFATGHIIPIVDLACLFAARPGVESTVVLTPANAALVRSTLDRSAAAGRSVRLLLFPFPSVGLPAGVENIATAPASETWRVEKAVELAQSVHEELIRLHRPDAVVADIHYWWTTSIAADLGIPRITCHPIGCFPQLVMSNLFRIRSELAINNESSSPTPIVTVPGLPGRSISIPRAELPNFLKVADNMTAAWDRIKQAQLTCHGSVVNTFSGLEGEYCEEYRRVHARRAWFVGPVSLAANASIERGGSETGEATGKECLRWLDEQEEASVVFVCFGSWCFFTDEQLHELAAGLEASGRPFLWALRAAEDDEWMEEGWEERVKGRGLVARGWVPQVAILGHRAVGAFLTHCGWNSVLEAAAAGVPMLTWPLVFEQFINERLVVEVVGAGRRVWEGPRAEAEAKKTVVPREAIASVVTRFMEAGGGREVAAKKATELAAAARAAVEEGGSSRCDLENLIDELVAARRGGTL
ncbi:scopoletin glucosyltransferase-like [Curcuma longa]|uniref:scopoletin glucosyltransferase-like n=1 Tax=Curcuma longa TaxID=136217 RepID=UPI003D9EC476